MMKLPKEKFAAAAREAKRHLGNSLSEAQKAAVEAERLLEIHRTVDRNIERLRAMMETRSTTGAEGLAVEASRNSTRRKLYSLAVDEKVEKARGEAERRSDASTDFLAAKAARLSTRLITNPLTAEQKTKKAVANAVHNRQSRLTVEQKAEKNRIDTERRNAESSQAVVVRLLDRRHRYATRYPTVVDSVVANASVSNKVFNVQPESDPVISSARTSRASREVQSNAQPREAARARAIKRRQQKLYDPVNAAEDVEIGAPTCDVNAHLNYVTATGIDVWNGDPEHVIDVIPDFTKPDIED
jgi:hypothetical protein